MKSCKWSAYCGRFGRSPPGQQVGRKHVIPSLTRFLSPNFAALQSKHSPTALQEVPFTINQEKVSAQGDSACLNGGVQNRLNPSSPGSAGHSTEEVPRPLFGKSWKTVTCLAWILETK